MLSGPSTFYSGCRWFENGKPSCNLKLILPDLYFSKISPHELYEVNEEEQVKKKAEAAFKAYDMNKDGVVTKKEMATMSRGKLSKVRRVINVIEIQSSVFIIAKKICREEL